MHHLLRRGRRGRGPGRPAPAARADGAWRGGRTQTVDVSLVDPVAPGDLVLVHAGVAISRPRGPAGSVSNEPTGFLYPFIDAEERDADRSWSPTWPRRPGPRWRRVGRCVRRACERLRGALVDAAAGRWRTASADGGRLFAFGNGGSATDAEGTVALFRDPAGGPGAAGACRWSTTGPC